MVQNDQVPVLPWIMSKREEGATVTSLEERRQKKLLEQEGAAAFTYLPYKFGADDVSTDSMGVTALLSPEGGIYMEPEDAEALGTALIQSAAIARMEKAGLLEYVDADQDPEVG